MRKLLILALTSLLCGLVLIGTPSTSAQTPTATPTSTQNPVPATWHGYLALKITKTAQLSSGLVSNLVEGTLKTAIARIARLSGDWPPYILQLGPIKIDLTEIIIEAKFDYVPTEALIEGLIADKLGVSADKVANLIAVTVFAPGGTWEESRAACAAYIAQDPVGWRLRE